MKKRIGLLFFAFLFSVGLWAQEKENIIPENYLKDPGKPVLVMFTASWCGPCQLLKADIFPHPDVKPLLKKMNLLMMDVDTAEGKKYQNAFGCGQKGIPYLVLLDKDQRVIAERGGYNKDASPYVEFLNKALNP